MSPKRRNAKEERQREESQRAMELFSSWGEGASARGGSASREGAGATGDGRTRAGASRYGGVEPAVPSDEAPEIPTARSFEIPTSKRDLKKASKAEAKAARESRESRSVRKKKERESARKISEHYSHGSFLDKLQEAAPLPDEAAGAAASGAAAPASPAGSASAPVVSASVPADSATVSAPVEAVGGVSASEPASAEGGASSAPVSARAKVESAWQAAAAAAAASAAAKEAAEAEEAKRLAEEPTAKSDPVAALAADFVGDGSPSSTSAGFLDNLDAVISLAAAEDGTAVVAATEATNRLQGVGGAAEGSGDEADDGFHPDLSGLDVATGIYSLEDPLNPLDDLQVVFDTDEEDDEDFDENAASILENAPDATFLPAPNFTTPEGATTEAGTPAGVRTKKKRIRPATVVKALAGVLVAAALVLCVYVVASFQNFRWHMYDDASDFVGSWVVDGTSFFVVFTENQIILSDEVAYDYTVDPDKKIIEISFGSMTGNDYYRFSFDRTQLLLVDNVDEDNGLINVDFWWYVKSRINQINPDFKVEFNDLGATLVLTRIPGTSPKDRPSTADFLLPGNDTGVSGDGEGDGEGGEGGDTPEGDGGDNGDVPEGGSAADAVLNLPTGNGGDGGDGNDDGTGDGGNGDGGSSGGSSGGHGTPIGIDNPHS